jgi:hypothetical protein
MSLHCTNCFRLFQQLWNYQFTTADYFLLKARVRENCRQALVRPRRQGRTRKHILRNERTYGVRITHQRFVTVNLTSILVMDTLSVLTLLARFSIVWHVTLWHYFLGLKLNFIPVCLFSLCFIPYCLTKLR